MITTARAPRSATRFRRQRWAMLVAALTAAGLLAGCGSDSTDSDGASTAGGGASTAAGDLAAKVTELSNPRKTLPIPTDEVEGIDKLRGKTVYYIPITQQAPALTVTARALTSALSSAGVDVHVCNGNSNPSDITSCVNQATGAGAAAIITDAIPYALAGNALGAAQSKGIPVLITNQIPDSAHPASDRLGYIEGAGKAQQRAIADWIIVDSGGKANVVINGSTDSPSTQAYVAAAQEEYKAHCPDCEVKVNKISSANFSLIASSTSSAILTTPGVGYVVSEFEQYLQPTLNGVQQSGKASSIRGAAGSAQITGLQMLASGKFLHVDSGQANVFQGWVDADAAIRMMLGLPLPEYEIPIRLFTRDNVKDITVSSEAEATGEWFGPTDFPAKFRALWGLG
ncbi:hypothetical protein FrEUN1fDRAFT_2581 [Parafrankia sp. EUN1f]|nr:hypothetical protein FrEUN1fDRAFT_2581 [Parafrankia sp. EUN1f]